MAGLLAPDAGTAVVNLLRESSDQGTAIAIVSHDHALIEGVLRREAAPTEFSGKHVLVGLGTRIRRSDESSDGRIRQCLHEGGDVVDVREQPGFLGLGQCWCGGVFVGQCVGQGAAVAGGGGQVEAQGGVAG
ncbi:UNVERIFIED_CONTAM: hypothetical protein DES50_11039 [Williamsia faeni]